MVCAQSDGRMHPPIGLWNTRLASDLRAAIESEGIRKIDLWTSRYDLEAVDWSVKPFDPFFNINHPEDLRAAEEIMRQISG